MDADIATVPLSDAVAHLHTALAELRAASLTPCSDSELLEATRAVECDRNAFAAVGDTLVAEVDQRGCLCRMRWRI